MPTISGVAESVWVVRIPGHFYHEGVFSSRPQAEKYQLEDPARVLEKRYALVLPDRRVLLFETGILYQLVGPTDDQKPCTTVVGCDAGVRRLNDPCRDHQPGKAR